MYSLAELQYSFLIIVAGYDGNGTLCEHKRSNFFGRHWATMTATFRDGQWQAISALVQRRERLLVVQRTGWGKSLVYFLATRLLRDQGSGCTILISPLLSLMRNQIAAARRIGVRAETINSTNERDWPRIETGLKAERIRRALDLAGAACQ